ncbi:MAG: hypothetical protein M3362_11940 [Acidobacteriota bacterium]|nr:hypothetical protein [Acidobacteriota bacterium]
MKIAPRLFAALLFLSILYPVAAAQESALRGTFVLDRQASDDIDRAIEAAVARPAARSRLRRTNTAYQRVVINYTQRLVSITFDQSHSIESPADGTPVKWTREDGERFDLSTEWQNGRLVQRFKGEGEERINSFTVSADGRTLTLNVAIRSPRLRLVYNLVYMRVS